MEFSIGTQAKSATPARTASSAAGVLSVGSGSTSTPPGTIAAAAIFSSAASLKVPSGPRKAMRATGPHYLRGPGRFRQAATVAG
jgi:hypothetical protein